MDEQPQADSPSVEDRLAAYFGGTPEAAKPQAPEAPAAEPQTEEPSPEAEVPEDDGLDDLDIDGAVYRVPKDLKSKVSEWKDGHLRREDYTRKTQELADITRQAQLTAETIQLSKAFESETQKERDELSRVTARLEEYKEVKWSDLDSETMMKLKVQMDQLKDRATELQKGLDGKKSEFHNKFEANRKAMITEGQKYLQKAIPNFGKEAVDLAKSAANSVGYSEGELENVYDARFVALSWKAAQYDRLQQGTKAVSQIKAPPVVKPGAIVQGTANRAAKDAREALKKTGSTDAFARALLAKGMVK